MKESPELWGDVAAFELFVGSIRSEPEWASINITKITSLIDG
jgi:hypothetical protein